MNKTLPYFFIMMIAQSILAQEQTNSNATDTKQEIKNKVKLDQSVVTATTYETTLKELDRNVYIIDQDEIANKGYTNTEEIFRFMPFVSTNNQGLGTNIDMRGQGDKASYALKVMLNGNTLNMLDSTHGVTPFATIAPSDIESIEVLPGGGAVLYGNGTRGGVINIITQKRYNGFMGNVGLSYGNVLAGIPGSDNYNASAKVGGKIGDKLHLNLGARYLNTRGYRYGDKNQSANVSLGLIYDISESENISFDVSYFHGYNITTPALELPQKLLGAYTGPINSSSIISSIKNNRNKSGDGDIRSTQDRLDLSLAYQNKLSESNQIDLGAFYHYNKIFYNRYLHIIPLSSGYYPTYQDGSYLSDHKLGYHFRFKNTHQNGELLAGYEGSYDASDRFNNVSYMTGAANHNIRSTLDAGKLTQALFAFEKYDFTPIFSLAGGARYEYAHYSGNRTYTFMSPIKANINDNTHNYAVEITPSFKLGEYGLVYAKYERGFISPSPNMLHNRVSGRTAAGNYNDTQLKSETYGTAELGFRTSFKQAFISGSIYHTLTDNEIYNYGSPHALEGASSYGFSNYDKTQRIGLELFSQQDFFGSTLRLMESIAYVDARVLQGINYRPAIPVNLKNKKIPYVSEYKATLGAFLDINQYTTLYTQNTLNGPSYDFANSKIAQYFITDIGLNLKLNDFKVNMGIKNLFNTAYFAYYNTQYDVFIPKSYIIGQGRTAFVEAYYTF